MKERRKKGNGKGPAVSEDNFRLERDRDDFPPFAKGSDTSFAAAASMIKDAKTLRDKVEAIIYMAKKEGCTCDEMEQQLMLPHQTVSARFNELHAKFGRIFDSGVRRTTRQRRKATVYVHQRWEKFYPTCPACNKRGVNCKCSWKDQESAEAARSSG